MKSNFAFSLPHVFIVCVAAIAPSMFVSGSLRAQENLVQPVYRVAAETVVAQPAATTQAAQVPVAAEGRAESKAQLDFAQKSGEHPLAPVIRALKTSQEVLDHNIRDYSCTFAKKERVDGVEGDYQIILLKVMHQPFSVYMKF